MDTIAPFKHSKLQHGGIRLLRFMPMHSEYLASSEVIQLTLSLHHIYKAPSYSCLSYAWGPPFPTRRILVAGKFIEIRENLWHFLDTCRRALSYDRTDEQVGKRPIEEQVTGADHSAAGEALKRSRLANFASHYFWIDQLCINQEDLFEREEQVARMGRIYKSSFEVIAYLGQGDRGSDEVMEFLEAIEHQDFLNTLQPLLLEAFAALFERLWFRRIWVLQEIHNAKQVVIVCGQREVQWSSLLLYKYWHYLGRQDFESWPLVMSVRDRAQYGSNDFLRLLMLGRRCDATDPRDKVYALSPMIQGNDIQLPRPDYTLSREEAYVEAAVCLANINLNFLYAVIHPLGLPHRGDLPSWVPVWDEDDGCMHIWPDTGKAMKEDPEISTTGDDIHSAFKINETQFYDAGSIRQGDKRADNTHEVVRTVYNHSFPQLKAKGVFISWIGALSGQVQATQQNIQASHSYFRSLWTVMRPPRTHIRYRDYDGAAQFAQHPLHRNLDVALSHQMWNNRDTNNSTPGYSYVSDAVGMHVRREAEGIYRRWREEVVGVVNGRRIFVDRDGGMGMAPMETRIGDAVCILFGAPVPFVVRPTSGVAEEQWQLVGACYLGGMMSSDAVERLRMEDDYGEHESARFEQDFVLC